MPLCRYIDYTESFLSMEVIVSFVFLSHVFPSSPLQAQKAVQSQQRVHTRSLPISVLACKRSQVKITRSRYRFPFTECHLILLQFSTDRACLPTAVRYVQTDMRLYLAAGQRTGSVSNCFKQPRQCTYFSQCTRRRLLTYT